MKFRAGRSDDIEPSLNLLRDDDGFCADDEVWAAMPDLLRRGLADGSLIFQVFESTTSSGVHEMVAFRISAFVAPGFAQQFADQPFPYVSARVWDCLARADSPLLNRKQVAKANAQANLHLGVLHWCLRNRNPQNPETLAVLALVPAAWQAVHGGYHVESIAFYEVYGPAHGAVMRNIGYQQLAFKQSTHRLNGVETSNLPACFSVHRDQVLLGAAALMGVSMFQASQPRFGLSPAQQRMVLVALEGAADRQLATELSIAYDSVRKAWESIYRRIEDVDAAVLPDSGTDGNHRGVEKRRHVLEYLRQHLEELRPISRSVSRR